MESIEKDINTQSDTSPKKDSDPALTKNVKDPKEKTCTVMSEATIISEQLGVVNGDGGSAGKKSDLLDAVQSGKKDESETDFNDSGVSLKSDVVSNAVNTKVANVMFRPDASSGEFKDFNKSPPKLNDSGVSLDADAKVEIDKGLVIDSGDTFDNSSLQVSPVGPDLNGGIAVKKDSLQKDVFTESGVAAQSSITTKSTVSESINVLAKKNQHPIITGHADIQSPRKMTEPSDDVHLTPTKKLKDAFVFNTTSTIKALSGSEGVPEQDDVFPGSMFLDPKVLAQIKNALVKGETIQKKSVNEPDPNVLHLQEEDSDGSDAQDLKFPLVVADNRGILMPPEKVEQYFGKQKPLEEGSVPQPGMRRIFLPSPIQKIFNMSFYDYFDNNIPGPSSRKIPPRFIRGPSVPHFKVPRLPDSKRIKKHSEKRGRVTFMKMNSPDHVLQEKKFPKHRSNKSQKRTTNFVKYLTE